MDRRSNNSDRAQRSVLAVALAIVSVVAVLLYYWAENLKSDLSDLRQEINVTSASEAAHEKTLLAEVEQLGEHQRVVAVPSRKNGVWWDLTLHDDVRYWLGAVDMCEASFGFRSLVLHDEYGNVFARGQCRDIASEMSLEASDDLYNVRPDD
jgi:hypothetical protein